MADDVLRVTIGAWMPDMGLSLNGRRRASPWDVRRWQADAHAIMTWALLHGDWHEEVPTFRRAHVTVEFVFPVRRRRDPDNLSGLAKPLLDVLVREKVLVDDDSEHMDLTVRAVVERGVTATRITVAPWASGRA